LEVRVPSVGMLGLLDEMRSDSFCRCGCPPRHFTAIRYR
jgi:hypothetical protein